MRSSAWKTEQRYEDILKGFLILIPAVLSIFLLRSTVVNRSPILVPSHGDVFLQIDGDIKNPGFYSFNSQPDIMELIETAGGIESVAHTGMDLATVPLHSGSKVTIQRNGNNLIFVHDEISSFHKITLGIPVSINMESEQGLTAVPGIGPVLAREIVKEKIERGGFQTLEDLKDVRGIGDKTYKKIITYVTL